MRRRQIVVVLSMMVLLSGCLSGPVANDTQSPAPVTTYPTATDLSECDEHGSNRVEAVPVDELGQHTLRYQNQSLATRAILKTAVSRGTWASCESPEGFSALLDRMWGVLENADSLVVWLSYRGEPYCLTVWHYDENPSSCYDVVNRVPTVVKRL